MAYIILDIVNKGEQLPVNNVDLHSVTNTELVDSMNADGFFSKDCTVCSEAYLLKNNMAITETATLSSLGFVDGDIIQVYAK